MPTTGVDTESTVPFKGNEAIPEQDQSTNDSETKWKGFDEKYKSCKPENLDPKNFSDDLELFYLAYKAINHKPRGLRWPNQRGQMAKIARGFLDRINITQIPEDFLSKMTPDNWLSLVKQGRGRGKDKKTLPFVSKSAEQLFNAAVTVLKDEKANLTSWRYALDVLELLTKCDDPYKKLAHLVLACSIFHVKANDFLRNKDLPSADFDHQFGRNKTFELQKNKYYEEHIGEVNLRSDFSHLTNNSAITSSNDNQKFVQVYKEILKNPKLARNPVALVPKEERQSEHSSSPRSKRKSGRFAKIENPPTQINVLVRWGELKEKSKLLEEEVNKYVERSVNSYKEKLKERIRYLYDAFVKYSNAYFILTRSEKDESKKNTEVIQPPVDNQQSKIESLYSKCYKHFKELLTKLYFGSEKKNYEEIPKEIKKEPFWVKPSKARWLKWLRWLFPIIDRTIEKLEIQNYVIKCANDLEDITKEGKQISPLELKIKIKETWTNLANKVDSNTLLEMNSLYVDSLKLEEQNQQHEELRSKAEIEIEVLNRFEVLAKEAMLKETRGALDTEINNFAELLNVGLVGALSNLKTIQSQINNLVYEIRGIKDQFASANYEVPKELTNIEINLTRGNVFNEVVSTVQGSELYKVCAEANKVLDVEKLAEARKIIQNLYNGAINGLGYGNLLPSDKKLEEQSLNNDKITLGSEKENIVSEEITYSKKEIDVVISVLNEIGKYLKTKKNGIRIWRSRTFDKKKDIYHQLQDMLLSFKLDSGATNLDALKKDVEGKVENMRQQTPPFLRIFGIKINSEPHSSNFQKLVVMELFQVLNEFSKKSSQKDRDNLRSQMAKLFEQQNKDIGIVPLSDIAREAPTPRAN